MERLIIKKFDVENKLELVGDLYEKSQLILTNDCPAIDVICSSNVKSSILNLLDSNYILNILKDYTQRCEIHLKDYLVDSVSKLPKEMKYTKPLGFIILIDNMVMLQEYLNFKDTLEKYNIWLVLLPTFDIKEGDFSC